MCGIAGFTHTSSQPDPSLIWSITRSITHRGPDEQNVWESPHVSLGAVRLKIIDLTHGQQPMVSDDGQNVLVFNGEVYNHDELRAELISLGHRFHSRCDTEVVLHAFLQWDIACFGKLRGMFAAALWNERDHRLVLVRDRMGIKPLYFAEQRGNLLFGSEVKNVLLHPDFDRRLNLPGLSRYLSLNYVAGAYTLVEGIEKLTPGHWLEWRDGVICSEPYWQLEFKPDAGISLGAAKEELDGLLRASVREHLVSDVPLGVWSSGGLDSSTILHYATEQIPSGLKTFSVSFKGRKFDESSYFQEVARHYSTDHHEFDLNPQQELADAIQQFATYSDEPSADAGALPVWFLSKMCRRQVTVALSGDGADELFGGYNTYLADRYARRLQWVPRAVRKAAAAAARMLPPSDEKIGLDYKLVRLLEGSLLPPDEAHFFWNGTFSNREKSRFFEYTTEPVVMPPKNSGYLNRYLQTDQLYYLPDDILNKCDRMSMAHSLEVRPPFLDHRIVEFAARLPESLKIHGGALKYVLRELMKNRLPAPVLSRRKEGFDIPAHHWMRTTLKPLFLDTVNEQSVRAMGVFDWPVIERIIGAHMERRANLGYHLWGLLVLFLWMRRWKIGPARSGSL